jgi:fatty acid desaturase
MLVFGFLPPAWLGGVTALSLSKILDNMEIGHNVMHGQYDWMGDPALDSATFEWDTACPAEQWRHSHNYMHHTFTNIRGKDWRYTGELFMPADYEIEAGFDLRTLKDDWTKKITTVFEEATLPVPEKTFMQSGGKTGIHTEHLGFILTELQYLQRTYPGAAW